MDTHDGVAGMTRWSMEDESHGCIRAQHVH